jgi:exosortase family protein XrtF
MSEFSLREFRPAILFVAKFIGLYLAGNLLYGVYITAYEPKADAVTYHVCQQVAWALDLLTDNISIKADPVKATVLIIQQHPLLAVYEGCNGVNVLIVFLSFVTAFGPYNRKLIWFIPVGLFIIHAANIFRIVLLFFVARDFRPHLYFTHKYLFTAFIYVVVFILWFWWIKLNRDRDKK